MAAKKTPPKTAKPAVKKKAPGAKPPAPPRAASADKPAAKRPSPPASPFHRLRGVDLVDLVIETARAKGLVKGEPEPLPEASLATLTFDNGLPLPASLRRWLTFDARRTGRLLDRTGNVLQTRVLSELFNPKQQRDAKGDLTDLGRLLQGFEAHVPHRLFPLDPPYDPPGNFVYLGKQDPLGEYPILNVLEEGGLPWVCLAFPGFDAYIAAELGLLDVPELAHSAGAMLAAPDFREAMTEQAALNFPALTLSYEQVLEELEAGPAGGKAPQRSAKRKR